MKYSKEEFMAAIRQLDPKDAVWIYEDYKAVMEFVVCGLVSQDYAEIEYDRLTEEALQLLKEKNVI